MRSHQALGWESSAKHSDGPGATTDFIGRRAKRIYSGLDICHASSDQRVCSTPNAHPFESNIEHGLSICVRWASNPAVSMRPAVVRYAAAGFVL
jgi:hypothetical protein